MSTLRLATAANIRAFQILTDALSASDSKSTEEVDSDALEDEIGRFRVWAGNLGALQKGHSSLDYRLRDSPNRKKLRKMKTTMGSSAKKTTVIVMDLGAS